MNERAGWENEAITRAINAEPWQPPPGMVKLQCLDCRFWFATADLRLMPRCVDCESQRQQRLARQEAEAAAERNHQNYRALLLRK